MKNTTKIILLIIFLLGSNISICQWETRSITLPLVKPLKDDLTGILDTIFYAEQKCDYYSDTLLIDIQIRINPDDEKELSLDFETQNNLGVLDDIGPLAYLNHGKHSCFIYFYIPNELFTITDSLKTFYYKSLNLTKENAKEPNNVLTIYSYGGDSFSHWLYYFFNNKFHFSKHFSYCDK